MENTLENKSKFFAQYIWQKVYTHIEYDGEIRILDSLFLNTKDKILNHWLSDGYYLELTPLSQITDEDVQIFADVLGLRKDTPGSPLENPMDRKKWVIEILTFNHNSFYGESLKFLECIDTVRSKGYALPWMGLSVEQLIEYKWIKLKQN